MIKVRLELHQNETMKKIKQAIKTVLKIKLKKISAEEFQQNYMKHALAASFEITVGVDVKIGTRKPFRLVPSKFYDTFAKEIKNSATTKVDKSFYAKYPFIMTSYAYNHFVIVGKETFIFSFIEESFIKTNETFEL
jgi:hypothetical protein